MSSPLVLVMAAGEGTRMRSSTPKMLHSVCGRPMVAWPIVAAREAGAGRVAAIVSPGAISPPAFPREWKRSSSRCPTAPAARSARPCR